MNQYIDKEMEKVFEKHGVFFAFSEKQFNEGKKEGVTYVNVGNGDLCPKENVKAYIEDASNVIDTGIRKQVEELGAEKIIEHEYFNYECQLSMDISRMVSALETHIEIFPELFTDELIKETSTKCFNKAVENDWF